LRNALRYRILNLKPQNSALFLQPVWITKSFLPFLLDVSRPLQLTGWLWRRELAKAQTHWTRNVFLDFR
jgi:hypothetical protein